MENRYEISKVTKNGVPYIQILDNYLAPLVINKFLFKHENLIINEDDAKSLNGYASSMIDKMLSWFSNENKAREVIAVTDPMLFLKEPLKKLESAMEWYDDRTGSKSTLSFDTVDKNGEGFSIETFNNLK